MIDIYAKTTPNGLYDTLLGDTQVGDASELHNALIVVCNILKDMQAGNKKMGQEVAKLQQRVKQLEGQQEQEEDADALAFSVALYAPPKV